MGIVLVNAAISLDGFIAGPNDEMDWVFEYAGAPSETVDEVIRTTGAILGGRGGYDVARRAERPETSGPFGGAWSGPQLILTHRPPADEDDPTIRFVSGEIRAVMRAATEAAGGRNVLVLGANVAQQCLAAGLVDEILLFVLPVLLGDGIRLFGRSEPIGLEQVSAASTGGLTELRYRVAK